MKEHIPPLTPMTILFQHVPVEWNGDLINITTKKKNNAVSLITANILIQSSCEMNVYNASNTLNLKFDTKPSCCTVLNKIIYSICNHSENKPLIKTTLI